jgi:hypothetical protein
LNCTSPAALDGDAAGDSNGDDDVEGDGDTVLGCEVERGVVVDDGRAIIEPVLASRPLRRFVFGVHDMVETK